MLGGSAFAEHRDADGAHGVGVVVAPLVAIFVYLIYKGASSLNFDFFTKVPKPPGEVGGGMANAIVGSAVLLGVASVIGVPIGIAGGIYLAESVLNASRTTIASTLANLSARRKKSPSLGICSTRPTHIHSRAKTTRCSNSKNAGEV